MQAPHHKTEGARTPMSRGPISFLIPPSPLNDLLTWWLDKGWDLVRQGYTKGKPAPTVFTSRYLQSYSSSTLSQWWDQFKVHHCPLVLKVGTITECRSSFIEAFTDKVKDEVKWERAAAIMGNSITAWKEHYAVSLKRRRCQEGADAFALEFLDVEGEERARGERELVVMELPQHGSSLFQRPKLGSVLDVHVPLIVLDAVGVSDDEFGDW